MKKGLTELVFILDKSGSMGGLESDTIGGYNSMLAKQQAVDGDAQVTTVLFDNNYELLHDRIGWKSSHFLGYITTPDYCAGYQPVGNRVIFEGILQLETLRTMEDIPDEQ
jgi:hypothetical protein